MLNLIPALILIILQGALGVEHAPSSGVLEGVAARQAGELGNGDSNSRLVREALRQMCSETALSSNAASANKLLLRVALLELLADGCVAEPVTQDEPPTRDVVRQPPREPEGASFGGYAQGRRSRDGPFGSARR